MRILGISAFYHDSAACLVEDGRIIAAAQEERFTRRKHDPAFPKNAVAYCLREAGATISSVDLVAFYEKPFLKFDRLLHSYLAYAPAGLRSFLIAMPLWLRERIWMKDLIRNGAGLLTVRLLFPGAPRVPRRLRLLPFALPRCRHPHRRRRRRMDHHQPRRRRGNKIELHRELHFPHSLGLLYSAFTYFTGFSVNSGEYKLMGLAPYGEPKYVGPHSPRAHRPQRQTAPSGST